MPPRLNLLSGTSKGKSCCGIANYSTTTSTTTKIALRPRITSSGALQGQRQASLRRTREFASSARRHNDDKQATGPNQNQLPHVSEEAGAMSDITGEQGPDLDQGTPLQDVC